MQRYYSCSTRSPLPLPRHIWTMCPHEQRDRPPPPGGESKGGIKGKTFYCKGNGKADSRRASQQYMNKVTAQ
jgi:hypothetical protein